MTFMSVPILVATAPAIAIAVFGIIVEMVPVLRKMWAELKDSPSEIAWLKDLVWSSAMLGTGVASYLGISQDSPATTAVAIAWFVLFAAIARALTVRLGELADIKELAERAQKHRKQAGTFRSIVRSELARAERTKGDTERS